MIRAFYIPATSSITIKAGTIVTCANISDCGGKVLNFKTLEDHTATTLTSPFNINIQSTANGIEYNLKAGTAFVINTIAQSDLVLRNISAFSGSITQNVKTISQSDYDGLRNNLSNSIKSTITQKMVQNASANIYILQDKTTINIDKISTDKQVGDQADILNMNMSATVTSIGYDKSSVDLYVLDLLKKEQKDNLVLDASTIKLDQSVKSGDNKNIIVSLNISAILKPQHNEDQIKNDLSNKSLSQIKDIIEKNKFLKFTSIKYSPNWAPDILKHIPSTKNIQINIEEVNPI